MPPHLDLTRVRPDNDATQQTMINGRLGTTRESSPASSGSLSLNNEDSMDVPERCLTPNKKAARASASTPETARGFSCLRSSNSNNSLKELAASRRRRLPDAYVSKQNLKKKLSTKGRVADRLSLKRKAMATLTAKKAKPQRSNGHLPGSVSDGELQKMKMPSKQPKSSGKLDLSRKRKSMGDVRSKSVSLASPSKKQKLRSSKRVESMQKIKMKASTTQKVKDRQKEMMALDLHPKKQFSTSTPKKRTFKPHRPMTRATTHLKSVLKAAKKAASRKLKSVGEHLKSNTSSTNCQTLSAGSIHSSASASADSSPSSLSAAVVAAELMMQDQNKLSKEVEQKRRSGESKKKKTVASPNVSNTTICSQASGEIRVKIEEFPMGSKPAGVVQCPTYYPSEEQFRDPISYIHSIQAEAERYGMCKVVPPCSWKMESRELEDFRFTTKIQYIHKMMHKWSPITEQLENIKRLNEENGNEEFHVPQIGGVDIDLVKLYELVQKYGGMKGTVGKEKKWMKIADAMKIPKQGDRVSKLYDAFCKYLLAYETLSEEETDKLSDRMQNDRNKPHTECYKCIYKGKSQSLSSFHRAARNTIMLFGEDKEEDPEQREKDYWEIVTRSDDHVAVQGASLDTSVYGSMFPVRRDNQYARHGWNLHNLFECKGSILHHLGLISGVTVPVLHLAMLFTTKCLSLNPHCLPTVQYLHQGPGIVWYAVPRQEQEHLTSALKQLVPRCVRDKGHCLEEDMIMIPPNHLTEKGVSMSRCVQSEREFVIIFPAVNHCNVSLGYTLSESVHYGAEDWVPYGAKAAQDLSVNQDVESFSMDAMLVFLAQDPSTPDTTLSLVLPHLQAVVEREISERNALFSAGLKDSERLHDKLTKSAQKTEVLEEIVICDVSNKICYLSMVLNSKANSAFSLEEGLKHVQKKTRIKHCKLMYRYSEEELKELVQDVRAKIKASNSASPTTGSLKRKTPRKSDIKSSPSTSK